MIACFLCAVSVLIMDLTHSQNVIIALLFLFPCLNRPEADSIVQPTQTMMNVAVSATMGSVSSSDPQRNDSKKLGVKAMGPATLARARSHPPNNQPERSHSESSSWISSKIAVSACAYGTFSLAFGARDDLFFSASS